MTHLVYLAGPISGMEFKDTINWRQYVMDKFHPDIKGLSPLRKKEYLNTEGILTGTYDDWPLSTQKGIYARDKFDCHRADLLFVNFLDCGTDDNGKRAVSIGTCMEIAWAAHNDTPIVLVMEDGNVHDHPMIREACPFIVDNLDEAIDLVHAILIPYEH